MDPIDVTKKGAALAAAEAGRFDALPIYKPEIECASREEIRALQLEKLKETVAYAYERVPYYRQKLDEMKKRRELEECYMKLGRMYYALLQEGTEEEETAHAIAEKAAAIKVMLESVNEKKRRENTEIHMVACPHCNKLVPSTAMFCSYCGKAIYPAEEK